MGNESRRQALDQQVEDFTLASGEQCAPAPDFLGFRLDIEPTITPRKGLFDSEKQSLSVNRLLHKMVCASSDCGDGRWHVGIFGYDDDSRIAGGRGNAFEQINAVQTRQLVVENNAGRLVPSK